MRKNSIEGVVFDLDGTVYLGEEALAGLGTAPERSLMVGDRLETDMRMGREAGMQTALTLTGVTQPADLAHSAIQPDYVVANIGELVQMILTRDA